MRCKWLKILGFIVFFAFMPAASHAELGGPIDWIALWGDYNQAGIDHPLNGITLQLSKAVVNCGVSPEHKLIKVQKASNLTGNSGYYFLNLADYFLKGQKDGCRFCVDGFCKIALVGPETQAGHECAGGNCKTLYAYPWGWYAYARVNQIRTMTAANYLANVYNAILDESGKSKYMGGDNINSNEILSIVAPESQCVLDEMDKDNDGNADQACIKYFQFKEGRMIDLYLPKEKRTVYTESYFHTNADFYPPPNTLPGGLVYDQDWGNTLFDDRVQHWRAEGDEANAITSKRLKAQGATYVYEMHDFMIEDSKIPLICDEYKNEGTLDVFIPTRQDREYQSFRKAVMPNLASQENVSSASNMGALAQLSWEASATVPYVSGKVCARNYTLWVGEFECPPQDAIACNQSYTITASRQCQRSSGIIGDCGECSASRDYEAGKFSGEDASSMRNSCFFQKTCMGPPCPPEDVDKNNDTTTTTTPHPNDTGNSNNAGSQSPTTTTTTSSSYNFGGPNFSL